MSTIALVAAADLIIAGATGVVIVGTGFGALQGTGVVTLSGIGGTVLQTVTLWADLAITITVVATGIFNGSATIDVTPQSGASSSHPVTLSGSSLCGHHKSVGMMTR